MIVALHLLVGPGAEPGVAALLLALLLTCSVHAAVWTGAAALLSRRRSLSSSTRHLLWKMALFGPLATVSLAAAMPGGFERAPGSAVTVTAPLREIAVLSLEDAPAPAVLDAEPGVGGSTRESAGAGSPVRRAAAGAAWELLAAGAAGAAALGLLRFTTSALLLWRGLRGRRRVQDARLRERLERLRARTGLRRVVLTESASVGSPLVLGASEICVPLARLVALTDAEVDAVFAHELAHLERRDGLWFPAAGLVQSVLWAQPLIHWASSRFRQTAEIACDDRAVELTGDPLGLARALVQVASGASLVRQRAMVPAMARSASALLPRVRRLLDAGSPARATASSRGRRRAIASLAAAGVAAAGLSVQVARARPALLAAGAGDALARDRGAALDATGSPPDAAAASEQMVELARREQEIEARLEDALLLPDAQREDSPDAVLVLELRQELRHVRAAKAWIEERFVDESTTWERRRRASGSAPR
ncbi:M56 family metallopeptidase [Sorangium sp. So ce1000]|uniref:M56 family metallopeptidase n=1 Tax=Sorangium sp. So ce1000 TaxID=3133325 RepID=UPI003F6303E0